MSAIVVQRSHSIYAACRRSTSRMLVCLLRDVRQGRLGRAFCPLDNMVTLMALLLLLLLQTFGKTPLIAVSPKKTLEGAAVGLSCTVAVTILLSKLLQWPASTPRS